MFLSPSTIATFKPHSTIGHFFHTNNISRNANSRARKGASERGTTSKKKENLLKRGKKKICAKKKELFPKKLGFTFFERYVKRFCVKERKSFPKKLGFSFFEKERMRVCEGKRMFMKANL